MAGFDSYSRTLAHPVLADQVKAVIFWLLYQFPSLDPITKLELEMLSAT